MCRSTTSFFGSFCGGLTRERQVMDHRSRTSLRTWHSHERRRIRARRANHQPHGAAASPKTCQVLFRGHAKNIGAIRGLVPGRACSLAMYGNFGITAVTHRPTRAADRDKDVVDGAKAMRDVA